MKLYPKMNSRNTALIVIDVVNGCCHKDLEELNRGIRFTKIRKMISHLVKFIEGFKRKVGGQVIFVNITPWTKKHLPKNIVELYTDPKTVCYSNDNTGFSEEFYLVRPEKKDIVLTKNTYDAFANPELKRILKKKGIQYLLVTGVFTDGCVLATICGGFQAGFNFIILKDLIETTDVKKRQELQKHLKEYTFPVMYGKTITSKKLLKEWKI